MQLLNRQSDLLKEELLSSQLDIKDVMRLTTHGASVRVGTREGVASKLKRVNPCIIAIHCVCHRLALACADSNEYIKYSQDVSDILRQTPDLLYLSEKTTLSLSKMRCKHYYKLFNECSVSEPTGIKKWKEHFPNRFLDWRSNFAKIYQITKDNKLRQFLFKILHRIIITKKELKRFNIATDNHCNLCSRTDSIMHTFLECDVSISIFSSTIKISGLTINTN